jgi:hypothetical protein
MLLSGLRQLLLGLGLPLGQKGLGFFLGFGTHLLGFLLLLGAKGLGPAESLQNLALLSEQIRLSHRYTSWSGLLSMDFRNGLNRLLATSIH